MDYKIASEDRDVALRSDHSIAARRSAETLLSLIDSLEGLAEPVQIVKKPRPLSSDPNDDMVLDVAINGRADAVVTHTGKRFITPARRYGIKVLSPAELLESLREKDRNAE